MVNETKNKPNSCTTRTKHLKTKMTARTKTKYRNTEIADTLADICTHIKIV